MAGMRLEIFKDKAGAPRLRLRAGNGRIIMSSEAYSSKRAATETAQSVQKLMKDHMPLVYAEK